jgi:hypothetical protein
MSSHEGRVIKISKNFDYGFVESGSVLKCNGSYDSRLDQYGDLMFHVRENRNLGPKEIPYSLVGKRIKFDVDFGNFDRSNQPMIRNAIFVE